MEKATNVTRIFYKGNLDSKKNMPFFGVVGKSSLMDFWVSGFEDGFVITHRPFGNFNEFVEVISGCFSEESNFFDTVTEILLIKKEAIKGIRFDFNGTNVFVTKEIASTEKILEELKSALDADMEKEKQKREAWLKSPEGIQYLIEREAKEEERRILTMAVLAVDENTEMEFAGKEGEKTWEELVKTNNKPYGAAIMKYARLWAKYMQVLISEGKQIDEIAKETSAICDLEGITGFMYGCAIDALSKSWKYGQELKKWHNKEWGYEGGGVANPAIISVTD